MQKESPDALVRRFNSLPPAAKADAICSMKAAAWVLEQDGQQRHLGRSLLITVTMLSALLAGAMVLA